MDTLLTTKEVMALMKVSRKTLDRMRREGFPKPISISTRRLAWRSADVLAWIESRSTK